MKIFKYEVQETSRGQYIAAPKNIKIIRMNHVDDGFYKGDFVWGIVDPKEPNIIISIDFVDEVIDSIPMSLSKELRVKEKQDVVIYGEPLLAKDVDGKLFIYYSGGPLNEVKIAFYKTGQEIDEPLNSLEYIGLCRLWIVQELGLYAFVVNDS